MPTQGEFFPKKSLSGKEEVCLPSNAMNNNNKSKKVGRLMETSGGSVVQEMRCGAYQIHTRVVKYLIQSRYIAD